MSIDISRISTDFRKEYRGVRMQQGRVLTDDDFNEAVLIDAEDARRTRIHAIGAVGSPDQGFLPKDLTSTAANVTFKLSAGNLYLGGHRLELRKDQAFELQTNWLNFNPATDFPVKPALNQSRKDLVWIEAWEQPVSAVEDDELFEVALGGADTGARQRIMHRVHVSPGIAQGECAQAWLAVAAGFASEGVMNAEMELATAATLKLSFNTPPLGGNLCAPPTPGGYLGAENQAVRVQMVDATHYTWGFDNAAPLYRVRIGADNLTLTMATLPKDAAHWPLQGQVVEILEWSAALPNRQRVAELAGHLSKVAVSFDPNTNTLQLATPLPATFNGHAKARADKADFWDGTGNDAYVYLRVWNRGDDLASVAAIPIPVNAADPNAKLGHTGLSVEFIGGVGAPLRKNDFWVVAARPGAPEQLVPWELKATNGSSPHGIKRYRAPLALLEWANTGGTISAKIVHDCRPPFLPLTQIRGCCTVMVGDGSNSFGHYSSINAAIAALPAAGGCVCVLPGKYTEAVVIDGLHNVTLHGCGPRSRIVAPALGVPAVKVSNSHDIFIESLALEVDSAAGLEVRTSSFIRIEKNLVQLRDIHDESGAWAGMFISADDVVIDDNIVEVLPPEEPAQQLVKERISHKPGALSRFVQARIARGGVQLAGGCERVMVSNNCITGGTGHGITLGSLIKVVQTAGQTIETEVPDIVMVGICGACDPIDNTVPGKDKDGVYYLPSAHLYDIDIANNDIYRHGANGIGVVRYFGPNSGEATAGAGIDLVGVHGLSITGNRIVQCLQREVAQADSAFKYFVGYGGIALSMTSKLSIVDNDIIDNGRDWRTPVCGVFALIADGLRIERNRILNNGPRDENLAEEAQKGIRAGVHIWLAYMSGKGGKTIKDSSPAQLRIDANQVVQPLGRALFLLGAGPMSVTNNYLASRGASQGATDALASTAFVANFGISKEWTIGLVIVAVLKLFFKLYGASTAYEKLLCAYAQLAAFTGVLPTKLPTGKLLFTDNQVSFQMPDGMNGVVLSSCMLVSLDDVGANDNQLEFHGGQIKVLADLLGLAASIRTNDNRLAETWGTAQLSALTLGMMNTAADNQATHCIEAEGLQTAVDNNLILARMFCENACSDNSLSNLGNAFAASGAGAK
jgi:hypothetical protein